MNGRRVAAKYHYVGHERFGDAFPEFLILWALFPIIFFSFSRSKLPGYILPSIPPITILTGDYLNRIRYKGLQTWLLTTHALLTRPYCSSGDGHSLAHCASG